MRKKPAAHIIKRGFRMTRILTAGYKKLYSVIEISFERAKIHIFSLTIYYFKN